MGVLMLGFIAQLNYNYKDPLPLLYFGMGTSIAGLVAFIATQYKAYKDEIRSKEIEYYLYEAEFNLSVLEAEKVDLLKKLKGKMKELREIDSEFSQYDLLPFKLQLPSSKK